jgi:hypothetical protein
MFDSAEHVFLSGLLNSSRSRAEASRSSACYEQAAIVVLDANDNDVEDDECVMPQDS